MREAESKMKQIKKSKKYGKIRQAKKNSTSINVLLWLVFSAVSLFIVLLFGITTQFITMQTYKNETSIEVRNKGNAIHTAMLQPLPLEFQGDKSAYLRYLAKTNDVEVYVLSKTGQILYPQDLWADETDALQFKEKMKIVLKEMGAGDVAVFDAKDEYVYAAKVSLQGEDTYLYVGRSLKLMETVLSTVSKRMILVSIFVFVMSFAVSGAVAAWVTRPLAEMAGKADALAKGDFSVDFHGYNYGREMIELADRLNYARDEIAKADGMQKELISNVSHDFKTPLTMIKAYASMIMEISGGIPEKRNKHAQVIIDEADRLALLVNDVLAISKMRSGIEEMQKTQFDLSGYLQEILERFAYLNASGYVFETDIEEDLFTVGDELKLGQVLYNLIGNAVNYTGEDKHVIVKLKRHEDVARLIVRDTGAGISREEIVNIWSRYYRSKEAHKRPVHGTGLGLSIVKTVLEMHAFKFEVDSKVGKGTVFYVDFPLVNIDDLLDKNP